MCNVCGCNDMNGATIHEAHESVGAASSNADDQGQDARHVHRHSHDHSHENADHAHGHTHDGDRLDFGQGPAHAHAPGLTQGQMVRIEQDILGKNAAYAEANRRDFARRGILAVNLLSAPGAGKTTLLTRTIELLRDSLEIAVVEGDQQTSIDADRIRSAGARAVQINTGKGCHLDAHMVGHAVDRLQPQNGSLLMIENVGNLVCPAAFDLGEAFTVVMLSITEGEDKPLKYPDIFRGADLVLIAKCDLLPHVEFDVERALYHARTINRRVQSLCVSARSGEGMAEWTGWLEAAARVASARPVVSTRRAGEPARERLTGNPPA